MMVKLRLMCRNYKEIMSAQNKEELVVVTVAQTWAGQPTGVGGWMSAGVEGTLSMGGRYWMEGWTRQCLRFQWKALLKILGSSNKSFLPQSEETLLSGGSHRRSSTILLLTQALAGSCPDSCWWNNMSGIKRLMRKSSGFGQVSFIQDPSLTFLARW